MQRSQLANELQAVRQRLRQAEDALHQSELQIGEIRHRRNTLTGGPREDYEIDIAHLDQQLSAQEFASARPSRRKSPTCGENSTTSAP